MLHLPESADSSLITLATIRSPEAQSVRMRLRLQWVVRILFGDTLYVSEGWSLDSLSFLQVANEILDVIRLLRFRDPPPEGIEEFRPLVLERRGACSYLDTLADYLARPDCRWTGFPGLAEAEDRRARILEIIGPARGLPPSLQQGAVRDAFGRELDDRVGEWAASVMNYEESHHGASIRPQYQQFHFYRSIRPNLMAALEGLSAESDIEAPIREELARVVDATERHAAELASSSLFLKRASENADELLMEPLDHLTRLAYMSVTTAAVGASYTSPVLPSGAYRTEALQRTAFATEHAPKIDFGMVREGVEYDFTNIASEGDWRPIWESVIRLSLLPEWKDALAHFRRDTSSLIIRNKVFKTDSFARLETLLQAHCKDLVVEQSIGDRFPRYLKIAKPVEVVTHVAAAGTIVASALAAINVPLGYLGISLAGAAGAASVPSLLERFTSETLKQWFNPLTGKTLRSTVLRAFRP